MKSSYFLEFCPIFEWFAVKILNIYIFSQNFLPILIISGKHLPVFNSFFHLWVCVSVPILILFFNKAKDMEQTILRQQNLALIYSNESTSNSNWNLFFSSNLSKISWTMIILTMRVYWSICFKKIFLHHRLVQMIKFSYAFDLHSQTDLVFYENLLSVREGTINMFRGGLCRSHIVRYKKLPPLTLVNCIQTPPKIFQINGDPPYILRNFLW